MAALEQLETVVVAAAVPAAGVVEVVAVAVACFGSVERTLQHCVAVPSFPA